MNEDCQSLIDRVSRGDREAFRELFPEYQQRVYAYLLKMVSDQSEAEDVLVDTMFTVWKDAKRFKGRSKLSTWIFGIAHNKALNALRARGRRGVTDLDLVGQMPDSRARVDDEAGAGMLRTKIRAALDKLSAQHREVIELAFYHGCSCAEIAEIVRCPINTVKSRMYYARQHLKQLLAAAGLEGGF